MRYFKKITELADRFEIKLSLAQAKTSAQPAEIEKILRDAGAFPMPDSMSPLLDTAKVPASVKLKIGIIVGANLNIKFKVVTNPNDASGAALSKLLDSKFSGGMTQVLKKAKVEVAETVDVDIATF